MRATFQAERYKYLFFACFAAGILLLCAARLENCRMRVRLILRVSVLTPVLLYMAVMAVCYLLHAGDAARHIRVSFSFWGTLLVYRLFSFDRRAQVRFGRYLLFLFLLTALTSAAAVLTDSSAARAISNASQRPEAVARDYVLMRRNVSGIYLFQDLVIFAPISVLMLLQRRKPLMNGLILGFVFLAVIKASFTIPLFVLLVVCILTVVSQRRGVGLMLLAAGGFSCWPFRRMSCFPPWRAPSTIVISALASRSWPCSSGSAASGATCRSGCNAICIPCAPSPPIRWGSGRGTAMSSATGGSAIIRPFWTIWPAMGWLPWLFTAYSWRSITGCSGSNGPGSDSGPQQPSLRQDGLSFCC